jgi:acyl-coenzyme A synthetase/AMP-(fatty) acid ligase
MVLPNGPEMATALVSVVSCATAAPLNPAYGAADFDFYLSDLNAKVLMIQSDQNRRPERSHENGALVFLSLRLSRRRKPASLN